MMVAGNFRILPWPKFYLVLFMLSFLLFVSSGMPWPYGKAERGLFFPVFLLILAFL